MAENILTKTYRPSLTVGQVYARPYGSTAAPTPIGNVLELDLEHDEDVQKQDDMTVWAGVCMLRCAASRTSPSR